MASSTVERVNRSCEKLGCNEPAEVAFGIDRVACLVWLENYDADEPRHLNRLCNEHASRLTLPRGWTFDDRREHSPRLWVAPRATTTAKPDTRRLTSVKTEKPSNRSSEKVADKAASKSSRSKATRSGAIPRRTSRDGSAPVRRVDGPGLFDPTLPINSPLLTPREVMPEPAESTELNLPTESHAPVYAPKFDRTSDVGGALQAEGRLLKRAFSSQTKPIERPQSSSDTDSFLQDEPVDDFHQGDHVE